MEEKLWAIRDRYGYKIYLTEERWEHIIDPENHPEMEAYEDELIETLRTGNRIQEPLNPQKYHYSKPFANLIAGNTHIVAIVLCRFKQGKDGQPVANNYIVTPYQKMVG